MNKETYVTLFETMVRGVIASAYLHRTTKPTNNILEVINGTREISLREIGEIGFWLDVDFVFRAVARSEQDDETD